MVHNISCYISSPGTSDGGASDCSEFKNVLRYTVSERGAQSAQTMIGRKIFNQYGSYLVRFCHFGTEGSIMDNLIEKVQGMIIDLGPVLGCNSIYNSGVQLKKIGLQADFPGLCSRNSSTAPDAFLKLPIVWKTQSGGIGSEGAGVNMWALLTLASLVGCDHIHCKTSSRLAQSLIKLILKNTPSAVTPGNCIPIRSFHDQTREAELIWVENSRRPDWFLRPTRDDCFASSGVLSVCPMDDNGMLPEDVMSCAAAYEQSKFLKCEYMDLPSNVFGSYQLIPGRDYCIYNKRLDEYANLCVENRFVGVTHNDRFFEWDLDNWQDNLKKGGWIVLPMIWRKGALVTTLIDDQQVCGCLVPVCYEELNKIDSDSEHFVSAYNSETCCYSVLTVHGSDLIHMNTRNVLKNLIKPGTGVWIKSGTETWKSLRKYFPSSHLESDEDDTRMICGKLNIPLTAHFEYGKACITIVEKSFEHSKRNVFNYRHVIVNPWEITLDAPENADSRVMELIV